MSNSIIYLNGDFVPEQQAKISVLDRGFLFADGVYEVIPVYHGKVLFLDEHLARLKQSLANVHIKYEIDNSEWQKICDQLIEHNGSDRPIYLQITRGQDSNRIHKYPEYLKPTVVALSQTPIALGSSLDSKDINVVTMQDVRWKLCHIKSISLLGNILLNQQASEQGAVEALLINNEGFIKEGSTSNFFIVKNNTIITPALNHEILPGITRKIVLDICKQHDIKFVEQEVSVEDLYNADEVWLTSSTREIRPVASVDGRLISDGKPGAVWQRVAKLYIDYINNVCNPS